MCSMMRWTAFSFLLITTGCTSQLKVLTEAIAYVQPIDFSADAHVKAPQEIEVPVVVEEDMANKVVDAVYTEDELVEFDELNDVMMPQSVGIPLTVEALVGQVNGRPVYANKVLAPVADQIEVASKKLSRSELADEIRSSLYSESEQMGTRIRTGRMYELVITDLLLSEAVGSMSKEQSYGILAVVRQMRQDLVSAQGGSHAQLRHDLEQQVGLSVDKFLELQRDQILIDALYRQKIWPKVNVTWRDIQREFEQVSLGEVVLEIEEDKERTNAVLKALRLGTPLGSIEEARGSVTLGMIRLHKEDPLIAQATEAFADGMLFSEVADLVGVSNGGVWDSFKMGLGGIEDIEVVSKIKKHLVGVSEGDILDSFELGSTVVWIAILEVEQPISLYNRRVQIAVQNALRWVQFNREKDRYVESLWGEGSLKEVKSMSDRVTNIAIRRYQ